MTPKARRTPYLLLLLFTAVSYAQLGNIDDREFPKEEIQKSKCLDNDSNAIRVIGLSPITPFAIIVNDSIFSAGQPCCSEWAGSRKPWYRINTAGKVTDSTVISSGGHYDVTNCFELSPDKQNQTETPFGLYTSKKVDWSLSKSNTWTPTEANKTKLTEHLSSFKKLLTDSSNHTIQTDSSDPIFFSISIGDGDYKTYNCMVTGGEFLCVSHLNKNGQWINIFNDFSVDHHYINYSVKAVLNLTSDKIPEIIFTKSYGSSWNDNILGMPNNNWFIDFKILASSIGGATI